MKNNIRFILNLANIILLSIIYLVTVRYATGLDSFREISPYLSLGYLIVVAYLSGGIARFFSLPSLSGYIIAGILFGPPFLGLIASADIHSLELINSLALSFIAITAGGELRIASLRKNIKAILSITAFHTAVIFTGIFAVFFFLFKTTRLLPLSDSYAAISFALLLGTLALANSPSSTIAIISEYKSRGDFTDIVLSVTMLKDTVVLVFFALVLSFVQGLYSGKAIDLPFLADILGNLFISGCAGVLYGFLMILFFKFVAREITVFIVLASFAAHELAHFAGIEHMFMCMVAGFTVQNLSRRGSLMIEAIENSNLPIYVVFFAIAGAGLDFSSFAAFFPLIMGFVVFRCFFIALATFAGARLASSSKTITRYCWTGFIANAGLALSMLIVVEGKFPGWGNVFKSILITSIAINQIIGPIIFKYGIMKSGEARKL